MIEQTLSHIPQDAFREISPERLEAFRSTEVVVVGLSSMGIAVVRNLIGSGIGGIRIIDDGIVTGKALSLQTTFSAYDIGKIKGIALKEKELGRISGDKLQLHAVQLSKENADIVIPKDCKIVIDASHNVSVTREVLDLAEERDFFVIGGQVFGWEGVFGLYAKQDKELRGALNKFINERKDRPVDFSTGITSFCLGGMISAMVLAVLLYGDSEESRLYWYNSRNQEVGKLE